MAQTATKDTINATNEWIASFKTIDLRELTSYADNHIGDHVYISGSVFNVADGGGALQIWAGGCCSHPVYVNLEEYANSIYENDWVTVYGIVEGYQTLTNAYGNEISQPYLDHAFIKK